ncbi:MAG TPA: M23 family metallopeptidase [Actinobacteria bacterium]|nr:M23 family metallopeptidase [Actinomycetota bacterium]
MAGKPATRWLAALVVALGLVGTSPASAAGEPPELTFPVVGDVYYYSSFGACRDGCRRSHEGTDIMTFGWKGVPVVAAAPGEVVFVSDDLDGLCCSVWIRHRGGWQTRYLHLGNDSPGTDDGGMVGIAPGIEPGAVVEAGQLVGWVGDSGNGEHSLPHVHFELRDPSGVAVDPYPWLRAAPRIEFRTFGDDPAGGRARVEFAYPRGAETVVVDPDGVLVDGTFDGPVLVGALDGPNTAALGRLRPERVLVVGDREVSPASLPSSVQILDHFTPPRREILPGPRIEGLRVVIVDDGRRLPRADREALADFESRVPVQRWIVDRLPRSRGVDRPDAEGAGVAWYRDGGGWMPVPVGPPLVVDETTPPRLGVVVLTRREVTGPTLRFLTDLAGSPPMPLWR